MSGSASAAGWKLLLCAGLVLIVSAILVTIEAVPYLMLGFSADEQIGTSATGHSKVTLALALGGAGLLCVELYRKRNQPGGVFRGQRPRLSVKAFRRIIWSLFLLEVGFFAWVVFRQMCPNELALEAAEAQLGLHLSGPHGMARCWMKFLSYSTAALIMTGVADVLGRRLRRNPNLEVGA
jgi:hypothetical protein